MNLIIVLLQYITTWSRLHYARKEIEKETRKTTLQARKLLLAHGHGIAQTQTFELNLKNLIRPAEADSLTINT